MSFLKSSMDSGRACPAKPIASSSRNDCRIASMLNEKIERNDLAIKKVINPMRMQITKG